MQRDLLIGIDAGTSVIKAVVFTKQGEQVAIAARPNNYDTPGPGQVEQDMLRTWVDCASTLRELHDLVPNLNSRLAAIAVTGQGDGTWLIDKDGEPVGGGLLWLDSRAAGLIADYTQTPAYADHYTKTGSGVNACMAAGQMAWMQRHQPERLARAETALHCKDWLYFKLTGARATDPAEASFTFGNFRSRAYEPSILEGMGISACERLLPPIIDGQKTSHTLSGAAASITGLPEGLPVVLAYLDVMCTALGGGLYDKDNDVGLSIFGTTGMHMRLAKTPEDVPLNAMRSGYTMCFPMDKAAAILQSNMAATLNIDWLLDVGRDAAELAGVTVSRSALLKGMDERILATPSKSVVYHPYIFEAGERGPFLNTNARAQFTGLSSKTGYVAMMRAVYEGLALASRDCYRSSGIIPKEIRMGGGAARSKALRTILASTLNANVRTVNRDEMGAAGAAMMAAVNLGMYTDMADCSQIWITPVLGSVTEPDPTLTRHYDGLYSAYYTIREMMPPVWANLASIRQEFMA